MTGVWLTGKDLAELQVAGHDAASLVSILRLLMELLEVFGTLLLLQPTPTNAQLNKLAQDSIVAMSSPVIAVEIIVLGGFPPVVTNV